MIHWFRVELIIKLVDTVQWMKEDRSGEDSEWAEKVKAQVRVFKQNSEMNVYEELRDLKTYLIHRKAVREYEEKLAVIKANFDEFRRKHVEEALEKFDLDNKEKQEELKWKWSPLFQLLRKWPLKNFRAGPWDHTQTEWLDMSAVLLENTRNEPPSLERECPHILRALLSLVRSLEVSSRPLSHPTRGLHGENLMELARDPHHSAALRSIAKNLPISGWRTFPGIHNAAKYIDILYPYVEAILGCEPSRQNAVVKKVESFVSRIAHRSIADMVRMQRGTELADMWYSVDIGPQRQAFCEEVWTISRTGVVGHVELDM